MLPLPCNFSNWTFYAKTGAATTLPHYKKGGGCFATGKHKENRKNRRRSSPRADKDSPQDVSSHLTTSWRERSLRPRHRLEEPQWPEPRGTGLQACKARWRWLRRRREDCADPEATCGARWGSGPTPSSTSPRRRQWSTESSSTYFEWKWLAARHPGKWVEVRG